MNLEEVKVGAEVMIQDLIGKEEVLRRVEAMGLRRGRKVEVLQKVGRVILLKLNNSRLAISRDIAKNIFVK
ncbi:FeoA family protein [Hydrogenobacter thermophilus TK-6]|uniref:Ferrous iron transport protein A n=1 Tax=Hydrogenobacter thermophilus (strain DSM 6534 / IAM 12695 / TK-6) TaxID=608538 RepID=D3DG31_HYDTT|nr:FeoA family protein [Hydrogenobacter thermophilus]ADO44718.1 FeoA family protein [Hydrogenobacter thermophilus TK-6]BAI68783.1 ferrous iron transport protein A [Hydrogenobacter thermophilus TK-6]